MVTTLRDRICQDDHTGSRVRASLALRACSGASFRVMPVALASIQCCLNMRPPKLAATRNQRNRHTTGLLSKEPETSWPCYYLHRCAVLPPGAGPSGERYSLSAGAPARWGLESDLINGVTTRVRVIILELARVCKLGAPSLPSPRSKAQRRCLLLDVLPPCSLRNTFGRSPSVCSRPSVPPPTFCFFLLRRT